MWAVHKRGELYDIYQWSTTFKYDSEERFTPSYKYQCRDDGPPIPYDSSNGNPNPNPIFFFKIAQNASIRVKKHVFTILKKIPK